MNGKALQKITFMKVLNNRNIVTLSCGDFFTFFITSNSRIHRAGCNKNGELFPQKDSSKQFLLPITTSLQRKAHMFGLTCGVGCTLLYSQKGNYFGEVYHHPKWKYNHKEKSNEYLMYRSIPEHFSQLPIEILPFILGIFEEEVVSTHSILPSSYLCDISIRVSGKTSR